MLGELRYIRQSELGAEGVSGELRYILQSGVGIRRAFVLLGCSSPSVFARMRCTVLSSSSASRYDEDECLYAIKSKPSNKTSIEHEQQCVLCSVHVNTDLVECTRGASPSASIDSRVRWWLSPRMVRRSFTTAFSTW